MPRKISQENYLKIRENILKKLRAHKAYSSGHMLSERLQRSVPPHLKGFTKLVLHDLLKEELVLYYGKTKYGDAYQLNIKKLKKIEEIIG